MTAPVDPAEPRLRAEVEKLRADANELRSLAHRRELERDQETQKIEIERQLRAKCEGDTMMAEEKLAKLEPVINELKATVLPTTEAVEAALKALKAGETVRVAANLVKALTLLTGEPVEAEEEAPEPETEPEPEAPSPRPKRPQKPKAEPKAKKKQPNWG